MNIDRENLRVVSLKSLMLLAACLTLLIVCACSQSGYQELELDYADANKASASDTAADLGSFESTDIDGNPVDEDIFSGKKLTMLNVWATHCSPCIKEMPDLGRISRDYASKDFQIIGVLKDAKGLSAAGIIDIAKLIISETGADYTHILPSDSLNSLFLDDTHYLPTTFFVDEKGNLVGGSYVGIRSEAEWKAIIDELL